MPCDPFGFSEMGIFLHLWWETAVHIRKTVVCKVTYGEAHEVYRRFMGENAA